jgi:hypothetical protein
MQRKTPFVEKKKNESGTLTCFHACTSHPRVKFFIKRILKNNEIEFL